MPNKRPNDLPKPNPYLTPISILIAGGLIAAALFINKTSKPKEEAAQQPIQNQEQQGQAQKENQNQGQVAGSEIRQEVDPGNNPWKGDPNAPVSIVEFSDFQCPYCQRYTVEIFPQIEAQYIKTGKVKYTFRNFPLTSHQNAQKAAEALLCSRKTGKFWEMHDLLFGKQSDWAGESNPTAKFEFFAQELGVDITPCLTNEEMADEVKADFQYGQQLGVTGTPAFFINGRSLVGAYPFEEFKKIIEEELVK